MQVIELKITDIKQLDKSILIYGAGKYASIFLTYLQTQGINSSVKGCIVSQIDDNKVFLSDLSVKSVDEIEVIRLLLRLQRKMQKQFTISLRNKALTLAIR